jgi:hypothetical protein
MGELADFVCGCVPFSFGKVLAGIHQPAEAPSKLSLCQRQRAKDLFECRKMPLRISAELQAVDKPGGQLDCLAKQAFNRQLSGFNGVGGHGL